MKHKRKTRPVFMYLNHGPFLREFASVAEASREMELSRQAIYHNLAGRAYVSGKKFVFYYEKVNNGIDSY